MVALAGWAQDDFGTEVEAGVDEFGTLPAVRARFDGKFKSMGEFKPTWDRKLKGSAIKWERSVAGEKGAIVLQTGCHPRFEIESGAINLAGGWTMMSIQRGADNYGSVMWSVNALGGERSFGLAANGCGGVKLWSIGKDGKPSKLHAMKSNVANYGKQFHTYAVVHLPRSNAVQFYVDGELAGEGEGFQFKGKGLEVRLGNIASGEPGEGSGLSAAESGAILEFRVYNMALGEDTMAELAGYNEPWPTELKAGKEKPGLAGQNLTAVLGVDLPKEWWIGGDYGERAALIKGVRGEGTVVLGKGGTLAVGPDGIEGCKVRLEGGTLRTYEKGLVSIKSSEPVELNGKVKISNNSTVAIRSGIVGDGDLVKDGTGTLGLQYACDSATGKITVNGGTLVMGADATWGGTVTLKKGAMLKCAKVSAIKNLENKGGKVTEEQK